MKIRVIGTLFLTIIAFSCNGIDFTRELTNALDTYFPIRSTAEYLAKEEIDKLEKEADPRKFRALLYSLLENKYIPPQDINLPVYYGGFHISYRIREKFDYRNINDLIFQLKLLTRLNSKYDIEYIYELTVFAELLYNAISISINDIDKEIFNDFINSLPPLKLLVLTQYKFLLWLYKDQQTLEEHGITPELVYNYYNNINSKNYDLFLKDNRMFPKQSKGVTNKEIERVGYYIKLTELKK